MAIGIVDHETATVVCRTQLPADKQLLIDTLLGHALYMKSVHGGNARNDDIDTAKISRLLRGGNIPVTYVTE